MKYERVNYSQQEPNGGNPKNSPFWGSMLDDTRRPAVSVFASIIARRNELPDSEFKAWLGARDAIEQLGNQDGQAVLRALSQAAELQHGLSLGMVISAVSAKLEARSGNR